MPLHKTTNKATIVLMSNGRKPIGTVKVSQNPWTSQRNSRSACWMCGGVQLFLFCWRSLCHFKANTGARPSLTPCVTEDRNGSHTDRKSKRGLLWCRGGSKLRKVCACVCACMHACVCLNQTFDKPLNQTDWLLSIQLLVDIYFLICILYNECPVWPHAHTEKIECTHMCIHFQPHAVHTHIDNGNWKRLLAACMLLAPRWPGLH